MTDLPKYVVTGWLTTQYKIHELTRDGETYGEAIATCDSKEMALRMLKALTAG